MADQAWSDRTELTTPADGDLVGVTDVSDTTDDAAGTTKRITLVNLIGNAVRLLRGLTAAANKIPYYTSGSAAGLLDFLDEDDFVSDSATAVASQQSAKAYVDGEITGLDEAGYGFSTDRAGFVDVEAIEVQEFTASGTLTKPDGARYARIIAQAAGGGGAGGYRNAEDNDRYGGGGGGPGERKAQLLDASLFADSEAVTIGPGGTGGAARTTNGVGNAGTAGGDTVIDLISGEIRASGGTGGDHASGLIPGNPGTGGAGRGGIASVDTTLPSGLRSVFSRGQYGGGGAGESRTSANSNVPGGNGGGVPNASGGGGGDPGSDGEDGTGGEAGSGGGGGDGTIGGSGSRDGGNGGTPGGGGGGGGFGNAGAGSGDTNSGGGGDGGDGYALVVWYR